MRKQHAALEAIDELAKKDIATTVAAWSPAAILPRVVWLKIPSPSEKTVA